MSFFIFLILLILATYVIVPVVKALFAAKKIQKQMNNAYRDEMRRREDEIRYNRKAGWENPREKRRKKVITKDMGEYVEFEEITEVTYKEVREEERDGKHKKVKEESRISDVSWDEI